MMKIRNTIQRTLVLDAVRELRCHATADEVYHAIVQQYPDISRATVYRNLNLLSELGEIRKIALPNGADHYDHICSRHYHVRCQTCGRVFDVDMDVIVDLERSIKDKKGFTFTSHDISFKGICPDCNQ